MEKGTINVLKAIISYSVIDNESNSNNEYNKMISDHTDKELTKEEIMSDLTRCQNQSTTHLGKNIEKQKANNSLETYETKNIKDDIVSKDNYSREE